MKKFGYKNIKQLFVLESLLRNKADDIQMYIDRFEAENQALGVGVGLSEEQQLEIDYALNVLIHTFYNSKDGNFPDFSFQDLLKLKSEKEGLFECMVRKLVRRSPQYDNHDPIGTRLDLVDARSGLNELINLAIKLDRINLKDS